MIEFQTSIEIDCPQELVFTWVTEPEYFIRWVPNLVAARKITPGPVGPGTRMVEESRLGPLKGSLEWQITEYEPPWKCTYAGSGLFASLQVKFTLKSNGDTTLLTSHGRAEARGLFRLVEPYLGRRALQDREKLHAGLKALLEQELQPVDK